MEQQTGHPYSDRETDFTSAEQKYNTSKNTEARIAEIMRDMHNGTSHSLGRSASEAWSPNSIYQSDDYEFNLYAPEGQCGVTNFTLGIILTWAGVVDINNIYYQEGTIRGRDGILSEHHAWIYIVDGDQSWRIDLTPHQYADINPDPDASMHMVLQSTTNDWTGNYEDINQQHNTEMPIPNAYSLEYEAHTTTLLKEYDITQFDGRLERFMGRLGVEPVIGAGRPNYSMSDSKFQNFWYPDNYDFSEESTEKEPGDFLGTMEFKEMLELIDKSDASQPRKFKDIERAYSDHMQRLLEKTHYSTLVTWAKDCIEHALPRLETTDPLYMDIQDSIALSQDETVEWNRESIDLYLENRMILLRKIDLMKSRHGEFAYFLSGAACNLVWLKASTYTDPYESPTPEHRSGERPPVYAHSVVAFIMWAIEVSGGNDTELLTESIWQVERLEELAREMPFSKDDVPASYYHPAGEATKVAESLHTYENNITALANKVTPDILTTWLGECAKRALLQFLAEIPADAFLVKNIRREAKDSNWGRLDTIYEFGKFVYEQERIYRTPVATLTAHVAANFYYIQNIDPTQLEAHWPEIKRIVLKTADFAAQAAIHNNETPLSERTWQYACLNELIAYGPSLVKPISYYS